MTIDDTDLFTICIFQMRAQCGDHCTVWSLEIGVLNDGDGSVGRAVDVIRLCHRWDAWLG